MATAHKIVPHNRVDVNCDEEDAPVKMHPALDFVDGVAYVAVRALTKNHGAQDIILSSNGEAYTQEAWHEHCLQRGLYPVATLELGDYEPRWSGRGISELQDGVLKAPTFREAYDAIYSELDARLQVRDPRYLTVMTLYAMMTYFHPLFDFLPILHLRGPAESGKSRAATIIGHVAFNGKVEGSATGASIFRRAHEGRYTQVITEADHLARLDSGDAFVQQLQAGCSKGEAWVEVTEGGNGNAYKPTRYHIFNPRILASVRTIKSQPLQTRCILLDIVKTAFTDETKLRRGKDDDKIYAPLRDKMYRLLLVRWQDVAEAQDQIKEKWRGPNAPTGRTFEKWLPLAAIASLVGEDVLDVVKEMAMEDLAEQQKRAANTFEAVVWKFAAWLVRNGDAALTSEQLYEEFTGGRGTAGQDTPQWAKDTETPVAKYQLQRWVRSKRGLTGDLARLDLIPKKPGHTRAGDFYPLNREHILLTIRPYIGDVETHQESAADEEADSADYGDF
jgi:hypothetical protein